MITEKIDIGKIQGCSGGLFEVSKKNLCAALVGYIRAKLIYQSGHPD